MTPKSVTLPEAAAMYGVSVTVLREHIDAGRIKVVYPSSKPVIRIKDLDAWLDSLPTERGSKR